MEQVFDGRIGQMGANLIVSLILIVVMLGIGAGAFLALVEDDNGDPYSFLDAVYFASVTVTTVGYGDFSWNSSDGAKIFGVFYLITGTVVIAKALSDIASIPLERRRRQLEKMVLAQYGEGLSLEELREITESSVSPPSRTLVLRHVHNPCVAVRNRATAFAPSRSSCCSCCAS